MLPEILRDLLVQLLTASSSQHGDGVQNVTVVTSTESESHKISFRYSKPLSVLVTCLYISAFTPNRLPQGKTTSPLLTGDYGLAENVIPFLWSQLTSLVTLFEQPSLNVSETWISHTHTHTHIHLVLPRSSQSRECLVLLQLLFPQILTSDLYFLTLKNQTLDQKPLQFEGPHTFWTAATMYMSFTAWHRHLLYTRRNKVCYVCSCRHRYSSAYPVYCRSGTILGNDKKQKTYLL